MRISELKHKAFSCFNKRVLRMLDCSNFSNKFWNR